MRLALLIAVLLAVGGTDVARASTPENGGVGTILLSGNAGWAIPSLGPDYLAMRLPRGTLVTITGPGGTWTTETTDYGPVASIRPFRVADVAVGQWERLCALPRSRGLCRLVIETAEVNRTGSFALPATSTEETP